MRRAIAILALVVGLTGCSRTGAWLDARPPATKVLHYATWGH